MKRLKMLLLTIGFAVVSSSVVAMETYKPKVYIKNQNTYSKIRSAGILCIINENMANEKMVFIKEGQDQTMIGALGANYHANDIVTLSLQPSTSGTGKTGWVFSPEKFLLTDKINEMLKEISQHPNQDILIVVKNDNYRGTWDISLSWIEQSLSEAQPLEQVGRDSVVRKLKEAHEEWKKTHGEESSSGEDW